MTELFSEYSQFLIECTASLPDTDIQRAEEMLYRAWEQDAQVLVAGNGGSAATADHFCCHLARGAHFSREKGCQVLALVGFSGGKLNDLANLAIWAQSHNYAVVEDVHLAVTHMLSQGLRERIRLSRRHRRQRLRGHVLPDRNESQRQRRV